MKKLQIVLFRPRICRIFEIHSVSNHAGTLRGVAL